MHVVDWMDRSHRTVQVRTNLVKLLMKQVFQKWSRPVHQSTSKPLTTSDHNTTHESQCDEREFPPQIALSYVVDWRYMIVIKIVDSVCLVIVILITTDCYNNYASNCRRMAWLPVSLFVVPTFSRSFRGHVQLNTQGQR